MRSTHVVAICMASMSVWYTGEALPQNYPVKPIRIITTEAGGTGDIVVRIMTAQGLPELLGQTVVVDNRQSRLAGDIGAKAAPDGYTLLAQGSGLWNTPFLQKTLYDPVKDFAPITLTNNSPHILAVHPALPVNSVKDLVALARAKPGQLNYATTGPSGAINLSAELFKSLTGVNMLGIFYKGPAQAVNALVGAEVQLMFPPAGVAAPQVKSGRLKALAITSAQKSALFPDLPTVAASGIPGYESGNMSGLFAPARTPPAIVNRLSRDAGRLLKSPELQEKFLNLGIEALANSPEEFAAVIKADMARVGKLIRDANIKAEN